MATPPPPPASHRASPTLGPSIQQHHQHYPQPQAQPPQQHPQQQQHHYGYPPAHMHPHAHTAHAPHHVHQPSAAGPSPELLPGPERAYYDRLFQEALGGQHLPGGHPSFLHGPAAVAFMSRSGLPKPALRQIWALCDPQGHGFLARPQFHLAMRLVAMAQAGYIDPMDPTLPGRVQARDPLSVALPQLPPVRLDAAGLGAPPMPPLQAVVAIQEEDEDEFGDFEGATSSAPTPPPPAPTQLQPAALAPSMPAAAAAAPMMNAPAPAVVEVEEEEDDDFGDFHAAGAEENDGRQDGRQESVTAVVTASFNSSSTMVAASGAAATTFEETTTAAVAATVVGPAGVTGLAVLSSQTATITTTASNSTPAPALAPASDMAARMAAFDAIVEEHAWGEFEEAEAGAAAPEAHSPPTLPAEAPVPLVMEPAASEGAADLLMGLGAEAGATMPAPVFPAEQPALSFGIGSAALLPSLSSVAAATVNGGGTLLDLDLLAPTTTASAVVEDPFAAAAPAPAFSGASAVVPELSAMGGSVGGGGAGMSRFMTETPPSSPKQVQEHQYRSPSPPLPSIHGLSLDQTQAAAGNPFASAEPVNAPVASLAAAGMGNEGTGSLMGLAGAGIGTGSIYEMSPYADPDAQGPSPLLGAASPPLDGVGNGAGPNTKVEKEDALTTAFREADAAASSASVGFGGTVSSSSNTMSRSHTGPFSPSPVAVSSLTAAAAPGPSSSADPFGFGAEEPVAAATAPVFSASSTGAGASGDDEWGAFNGSATAPSAADPALAPAVVLAPAPAPAPASDDPFAGLHADEEEEDRAVAAGAIQHEEVSPSSRGSTSPDRALGGKATVADAAEQAPPPQIQQLQQDASAAPQAPVVAPAPAPISKPQEPADPWSHPDPWGTETSQPVGVGGGGVSASTTASASVGSILLDPLLHAPPTLETAAPAVAMQGPSDGGLAAVLPRLWAKGLLGPAAALTEHLEAQRALPEAAAACEAAKREDRLEEALALKRRMRELEGRVAGEAQVAAWCALIADGGDGEEEHGQQELDVLLERLRQQVEAGAGAERAEAFAQAFVAGQPTLAAQARGGDARGALRRARRAWRCAALVLGMAAATEEEEEEEVLGAGGAGGALAAYPQHWQRTLATAGAKLGEAAGFCRRVTALPSAETRKEVGASLKVRTFVEASVEILRVARFVRAAAGDALLALPAATEDGVDVEALAEELRAAVGEMGLEAAVAAAWPLDVAGVRDAVADCGGDDEAEPGADVGKPPAVDPRSVCNLCLLPLAAARALGGGAAGHAPVPVTYFSGAAYHSACCNLWLNGISLETPQPTAGGERVGLMGTTARLSGDAMDGSVSVSSGLTAEEGGIGNGDVTMPAVPAVASEGAALAQEVPF